MIKKILFAALILLPRCVYAQQDSYAPIPGDFIFQSLPKNDLVDAIEGASQSLYSHVGMVIRINDNWFVRESFGSVHDTALSTWIARGRSNHGFDVFRLKPDLQRLVPAFVKASDAFLGRPYDDKYTMDDATIYCSELLYKAMLNASGIHLGKLQKLGDLNWQPYSKAIEKYEGGKPPLERQMITPRSLSEAAELRQVFYGYQQ